MFFVTCCFLFLFFFHTLPFIVFIPQASISRPLFVMYDINTLFCFNIFFPKSVGFNLCHLSWLSPSFSFKRLWLNKSKSPVRHTVDELLLGSRDDTTEVGAVLSAVFLCILPGVSVGEVPVGRHGEIRFDSHVMLPKRFKWRSTLKRDIWSPVFSLYFNSVKSTLEEISSLMIHALQVNLPTYCAHFQHNIFCQSSVA